MIHTRSVNSICLEIAPTNNALFETLLATTLIQKRIFLYSFYFYLYRLHTTSSVAHALCIIYVHCTGSSYVCVHTNCTRNVKYEQILNHCRLMSFPPFKWLSETRTFYSLSWIYLYIIKHIYCFFFLSPLPYVHCLYHELELL